MRLIRWAAVFLLFGLPVSACSSSVLIHRDDSTFVRAQSRLARTTVIVDQQHPEAADRALFLQAESFYRYRFEPPPRGVLGNIVQAAAVAVELPMLQAVAGSLDILDLRLRTYDGAVHLWESMLLHNPQTVLRPLTLYRLGWAYRSSGVSGFPRDSGDEAFDELIRLAPATPLGALALQARAVPWKSKEAATAWSIVPGLGQIYVGEPRNGVVRLALALASAAMVAAPAAIAYQRRDDLTWNRDWPLLATAFGGLILLSIDYTTAYQDALRGVVQWNERAEATFDEWHPEAP